jgi:hypothetical protein
MFGLFGGQRKAAARMAVAGLQPFVASLQRTRELPPRFWMDEYVLGFMTYFIAYYSKLATNGRIMEEQLGSASAQAYAALSNMDGSTLVRRSIALATERNVDFNRGADDAAAVVSYLKRILRNESRHPLAQRAAEVVDRVGRLDEKDRRAQIVEMMIALSFVREVEERFDLKDQAADVST